MKKGNLLTFLVFCTYISLLSNLPFFLSFPDHFSFLYAQTVPIIDNSSSIQQVQLIYSSNDKIIVEIYIPDYKIIDSKIDNYQLVAIQGYSQTANPGNPQLPVKGLSIGIPYDAQPTLEIVDTDIEYTPIGKILPAPFIKHEELMDPVVISPPPLTTSIIYDYRIDKTYTENDSYLPADIVRLGPDYFLREQRIQTVQLYPVQYNPAKNEIKVHKRIRFVIKYHSKNVTKSRTAPNYPKTFESILRSTIVNYEQAKLWRNYSQHQTMDKKYFLEEHKEWYKILLRKPGLYYLNKSDLQSVGIDVENIDPRKIKIYNKGVEIAINVIGENDGLFDENDTIEFYACSFKNYFTTTNVYWLTIADENGKRMEERDVRLAGDFPVVTRGKERFLYELDIYRRADFPGHTDNERFFTTYIIAPMTQTFQIDLPFVSDTLAFDCIVEFKAQGISGIDQNDPDHHSIVLLNSDKILDVNWDGRTSFQNAAHFSQSLLEKGNNIVDLIGPGDTGALLDWQWIDYFSIEYWRDFVTTHDSLFMTAKAKGTSQLHIKGLSPGTWLYDVTDSSQVIKLVNFFHDPSQLQFQDDLSEKKKYFAISQSKKIKPDHFYKDESSNLRSPINQADYIIITHDLFSDEMKRFAEYLDNRNYNTKVINVQDIYDEFNFGFYQEKPIQEFMKYTFSTWTPPAPTYLLLAGDASWNPCLLRPEEYGAEKSDFVPTRLFEATLDHFEAASDNYFGCTVGDDVIPDVFVGRFPARTKEQITNMIDKVIGYDTNFSPGIWNNTASFAADDGERGILAFEDSSDAYIRDLVPDYFDINRLYLSELGASETKQQIKNSITEGSLILNYYGHGSTGTWAAENIFSRNDIYGLKNDYRAPFVLTQSCINGYFMEPKEEYSGLAEVFFREPEGGAIAAFSGSGEAFPSPVLVLGRKMYSSLFLDRNSIIGSFTMTALLEMFSRYPDLWDHLMYYTIFGDPSTKLHYLPESAKITAGFEGTVQIDSIPAPINSQIIAEINNVAYASTTTLGENGFFGPLEIEADNPLTSVKDGGAEGDTIFFKAVITPPDTISLYPCAIWKANEYQYLKLSSIATYVQNAVQLNLRVFVDDKELGLDIFNGDPISKYSNITVTLETENNISLSPLPQVKLYNNATTEYISTILPDNKEPRNQSVYHFSPANLNDGIYELDIIPSSNQVIKNLQNNFCFTLQSSLKIENVLNYPNPMAESTSFTFLLHNDILPHIFIKIYTSSGRLVHTIDKPNANIGFNKIFWDGRDENGDKLANGVYIYKIIAKDTIEYQEVIERLLIMN